MTSIAQKKPDPKDVDAKTFALYSAGKWDELAEECERAIDNGVDFFYLRLRAGIAYYNNGNYMSAIPHFEKAAAFNPADIVNLEYLYYSYLFSGRESDVLALIYDMPLKLKKKLQVYNKFIYGVYTEGGYTANSDFKEKNGKNIPPPQTIYNEEKIFDFGTYLNLSIRHQLGKRVKIFHGYNNISVSNKKEIFEPVQGPRRFDIQTKQDEYYLNVNFSLGKGLDLTTAFHYLHVKDEDFIMEYKNPLNPINPVYTKITDKANDFVAFLSLSKYIGHFKFGLKNSIANMNKATQVQNTAQIIFFPLGNLNLYTITDATLFSNRGWGYDNISYGIVDQKFGWKVFDNLWMEAGYTFGKIYNYNESDAFLVFNNVDKISNRTSLNFIVPVSKQIELSFRYQYYNQEVTNYTINNLGFENINLTNNTNHKIIGGLKWTF